MEPRMRTVAGLAFLSAAAACGDAQDSPRACTTIGCQNGFAIALHAAQWTPGTYEVMITADDRTIVCSATLPLPKTYPQSSCSSPDVILGTSGSELPFAQQSLHEVRFSNTFPNKVTIMVSLDSTKLAEQTFSPQYVTSQPNGPGCAPVCTYASASLSW